MPTNVDIEFLQLHWGDDPMKLLFASKKYPEVDVAWVAQQIEGRRQALIKWPEWADNDNVWYPPKLNREQASSSALAQYKATQLGINNQTTIADVTGGMGVDSYYFSLQAKQVYYVEQDERLVKVAKHNMSALNANNVTCCCGDSIDWLSGQDVFDIIYIDPARRDAKGAKVFAFEECQPDVLSHLSLLLQHCKKLVIKASPMISIPTALQQLQKVSAIHVVALKGECKEVLFEVSDESFKGVICSNLESFQPVMVFLENEEQESEDKIRYSSEAARYLYEPNAAIMKSGYHKSIAVRYDVMKLARNTHLYTSDLLIPDFPGRCFEIIREVKLTAKEVAKYIPQCKAHVISRNHPDAAPAIQKKLKISEGGDLFVIATTLGERPTAFIAQRV